MTTLLSSEIRSRREIVKQAIGRLIESSGMKTFRREDLFASSSLQSGKPAWQRVVVAQWAEQGIVLKTGHTRNPFYTFSNTEESRIALRELKNDHRAIEQLMRDTSKRKPGQTDELPDLLGGIGNETDQPAREDATTKEMLAAILKLAYGISEAVMDLRARMDSLDLRIKDIEKSWFGDVHASEAP